MKKFIQSLSGKITLIFLMIAIPASISIIFYGMRVRDDWKEQRLAVIENETSLRAAAMDQLVSLLEDTIINLPIKNPVFEDLERYSRENTQTYWNMVMRLKQQLDTVPGIYSFVENIFIYYPEQDFFLNNQVNPEMTEWICSRIDSGEMTTKAEWSIADAGKTYLYYLYPVRDYYLGVWLPYDDLVQYVCRTVDEEQGDSFTGIYFAASPDGRILTSDFAGESLSFDSLGKRSESRSVFRVSRFVQHPGIYLFRQVSRDDILSQGSWHSENLLMVALLLLALLTAVLLSIGHWVLRPMRDMVGGIERISAGDIDHRLTVSEGASSEFRQIVSEFNEMVEQLEKMHIRIYEQELEQQETKLRYLGQQVQPHFILNSLNTLYTYSNRDVEETRKIIRLLSEYYRYVVNIESRYVRLEQELEHLEKFLSLQKIRFPSRLNYEIRCDENAAVVPIPPFLLENFISNALKYGQNEDGTIRILLEAEQIFPFVVSIRVSDEGNGFSKEVLEAIDHYRETGEKAEELGVGIANCMERLSLIYHERAAIRCFNREDPDTGKILGATVETVIHLAEDQRADGRNRKEE